MANTIVRANGMPVDQPLVERPGLIHREADAPGNARHLAREPEAPERQDKGDIGWADLEPPRPLTHGGLPFKNARGGR
jgi:hypothetical protein